MSHKVVNAIALGTVATSVGIMHFDPDRSDEDGRYQSRILPTADAERAEKRGLVEIGDDASEAEFKAQQAGISARPAEVGAERLGEMEESPVGMAGGSAPATATIRNFPAGQGREAARTLDGDPDAAPVPGGRREGPAILNQSIPKLKAALEGIDDADELDSLRTAEEAGQDREGAKEAIDDRKAELAGS